MSFLSGDLITAQRLNRLRPTPYSKASTAVLPASSTTVDVPGATITFTTETDGAEAQCVWFMDCDLTGATTTLGSSRLLLDGVTPSDNFAVFTAEVATDRASIGNLHKFTIPTAGSHTIKMQGTTPANYQLNIYTGLQVTVYEVV